MSKKPEPNPRALVISDPKALAVASRQLLITHQSLARIEQEQSIEFFATHPKGSRAFVKAVSKYYACSDKLIERYAEYLDWQNLVETSRYVGATLLSSAMVVGGIGD